MSWVKIDDQFFSHPKVIDLPKDAKLLYLAALTYCASQLTDGLVTPGALRVIAATADVSKEEASALVSGGLWEKCDAGWLIHDYHDYQPTRESAIATRQARSEAGSRGGTKSAESKAQANAQANAQAKSQQMPKQNAEQNSTPSPSPSPSPNPEPPAAQSRAREAAQGAISHPALTLFRESFRQVKGRDPAENTFLEAQATALYDSQGEATYRRALDGFFGCLAGSDPFPKTKGFDIAVFIRQFDVWEGGSPPPAKNGARGSPAPPGKSALAHSAEAEEARLRAIFEKSDLQEGEDGEPQRLQ